MDKHIHTKEKEATDLNSILEDLPVAFYTCDARGYITFCNRAMEDLCGRKIAIGVEHWSNLWKIFYADGSPMPVERSPMAITLGTGEPFDGVEIQIQRTDQTYRHVRVYPKSLFDHKQVRVGAHNTLVDITTQKHLDKNQSMLASIIESSEDAIISKDLNGMITSWNDTSTAMFGYTREEIIGKSITTLIPIERIDEENNILSSIRRGERIQHFETKRLRKDGSEIDISLTISPIKNEQGTIIGASKIARNITEQVAIRRQLKKHAEKLEALNQHKDEFISLASHELKTPLTSVKGYVQLLSKMLSPNSKDATLAHKAGTSITRLEGLINDLLDVSKIQEGKLVYNMEPLPFAEIMQSSVESIQHLSDTHTIHIIGSADVVVYGDRVRLEQMLNNFLTNAIKYSPHAKRVEVKSIQENHSLLVSVRDYGIGIPEESIAHLVERHYRADNASMRFAGLGLGLYITHEIVNRHQGKLWIESILDEGSTFYVRLPIMRPDTIGLH